MELFRLEGWKQSFFYAFFCVQLVRLERDNNQAINFK